jgi:hypothetical protein
MDAMSHEIGDIETGIAFLVTALILVLWGLALLASEYRYAWRCRSGWRRFLPPTFSWWLGAFVLLDAGLWAYLGVVILTTPDEGVPLWAALYFGATAICALVAFRFWARERVPGRAS